jgi:hypothetical protein
MKKEIDYKLEYYDNGELKEKDIKIFFTSQKVTRDYGNLLEKIESITKLEAARKNIVDDIGYAMVDDKLNHKEKREKIKALNDDLKIKTDNVVNFGEGIKVEAEKINDERFDILTRLLRDNKIEDEDLLSFEFWDEKVDPASANAFLRSAVNKDYDSKKKL